MLSIWATVVSCNSNKQIPRIYTLKECDTNFKIKSLRTIIDSKFAMDKQLIEVTGYISWGTEEMALGVNRNEKRKKSMMWIDFRSSLVDSLELNAPSDISIFQNLNGKKVTVRGIYNANQHGHLEQYAATINNICYIKIW